MTDRLNQIVALVPPGVTPEDVIDLVDGRLPKSREAVVIDAISRQPRLGALIKQLRDDRDGLALLQHEHAPAGMLSGIESRLQTQALRELASAEAQIDAGIPVSTVEHVGPGALRILLESVWARRLATAASLAIIAGLAVAGARHLVKTGTFHWPYGIADRSTQEQVVPSDPTPAPAPEPTAIAGGTPAGGDTQTIASPAPADRPAPITLAQAMDLAREHRLAIVVRTLDTAAGVSAVRHVDAVARGAGLGRDGPWTVVQEQSAAPALAALWTPAVDVPGLPGPMRDGDPSSPNPTVVAGDHGGSPPSGDQDVPSVPASKLVVKAMYVVSVTPSERAIETLRESLTIGGGDAHIAFRALAEPVLAELSAQPRDVLWWSGSPADWLPRRRVPVIIETVE